MNMTKRRALALAMMALNHVADMDPDVTDWRIAAAVIRRLAEQERRTPAEGTRQALGVAEFVGGGGPIESDGAQRGSNGGQGNGWREVKTIKGHEYVYWRWREGGRLRSRYMGKAADLLGSKATNGKGKIAP